MQEKDSWDYHDSNKKTTKGIRTTDNPDD